MDGRNYPTVRRVRVDKLPAPIVLRRARLNDIKGGDIIWAPFLGALGMVQGISPTLTKIVTSDGTIDASTEVIYFVESE